MSTNDSWTCPYCNQPTTITSPNIDSYFHFVDIDDARIKGGSLVGYKGIVIACPNAKCKQLSFSMELKKVFVVHGNRQESSRIISNWSLLPVSKAKPQPTYIPKQLVIDYTEACRIKDLSPKASATLSRRCLQGMIRDYWKINTKSKILFDEINELKTKISDSEWQAIDAVRSVGNIGAHMEQDVNLMIDVEPQEAELLISLIEDLFKSWYIDTHDREERQKNIITLAVKKNAKKGSKK